MERESGKVILKRITAVLMAVIMLLCVAPLESIEELNFSVFDSSAYDDEFGLILNEGEIWIDGYYGSEENVVIPSEFDDYEGYVVTKITDSAFQGETKIKSVTIPEGVNYIGRYAFEDCISLETVNVPDSVNRIRKDAFNNTAWYDAQPDGIVYAGKVAYAYKGEMPENTSVVLKDGTTGVSDEAFANCSNLVKFESPSSVTDFDENVFSNCTNLKEMIINGNVFRADLTEAEKCTKLSDVYFGGDEKTWRRENKRYDDSVFEVHYNFKGCKEHAETEKTPEVAPSYAKHGFTEGVRCTVCGYYTSGHDVIHFNDVVDSACDICGIQVAEAKNNTYGEFIYTYIDDKVSISGFNTEDNDTKNLIIPSEINDMPVVSIGNKAFYFNSNIESVVIPEGVTAIGDECFFWNRNMKSITIPETLKAIGDVAFYGCAFEEINLPDDLEKIGYGAFSSCTELEELVIPGSVKVVEPMFNYSSGSSGVKSIVFEDGVEHILGNAFTHTSLLQKIVLPESLKSLGSNISSKMTTKCFEDIYYKGTEEQWENVINYIVEDKESEQFCIDVKISYNYCGENTETKPEETTQPTTQPTTVPTTQAPVTQPTTKPTEVPTTVAPTEPVTQPTTEPATQPTIVPTTVAPTESTTVPTTQAPVTEPTTKPSEEPTTAPSTEESTTVHTHTEVIVPAVEATYTEDGLTEGKKCSECGEILVAQKKVARKKLKKVTSLKVKKTTANSVTLSWKKVTGAEGYKVYCSTNGKKWKSVRTTKNSVTVKKLSSAKNYQFKVKAVVGKYSGEASKVVKATTKFTAATLSSVKSSKKKQATVTWKQTKNASGYVIEYSTSKKFTKKTTKTVTVKKGKTTKTTLKKLKSGKKYYVRVKAYKTVSKKAVYGAYSKVKTVKTK